MGSKGHDLHLDVNLSNVAMQYRPDGMIADLVAPVVPVVKQSNAYPIWSQADALRVENDTRAPGAPAHTITRSVSSDTYACKNYALKTALTLEDRENMDDAFIGELRNGKAAFLKSKLSLGWEKRVADQLTTGTNIGSYSTVASDWMDYANGNSDPLGDCESGINVVLDTTGYRPNRCVMGELAWRHFRRHADVIGMLHGNSGNGKSRLASREQFKDLFELDEFLVGAAYYNSAAEGQAQSLAQLWMDNVLFYHAPPAASVDFPSFMYSFRWQRPGLPNMVAELHPFDSKIKAEEVELGYYQDEKITGSTLGYLITHVTSV